MVAQPFKEFAPSVRPPPTPRSLELSSAASLGSLASSFKLPYVHTHMAMSTLAKGLFLFLAVVASASGARGSTTWISNGASRAIVATTSYIGEQSKFVNRVINPNTSQKDDYNLDPFFLVHVELWVSGAGQHNSADIDPDRSLVGFDHGAGTMGVDIYLAKHGTLFQREGNVLITIFLNNRHNSTGPRELS